MKHKSKSIDMNIFMKKLKSKYINDYSEITIGHRALVHGNGLHLGELVLVLILLGVAGVELLPPRALYGPHSLRWVRLPALIVGAVPASWS